MQGPQKTITQIFWIILVSLLASGATYLIHPNLPAWDPLEIREGEISVADAMALEAVIWIDARSEEEYNKGHIPGAILINEDDWDSYFGNFMANWGGETNFVVYCDNRLCDRSTHVADRLKSSLELETIYELKGGWQVWLQTQQ